MLGDMETITRPTPPPCVISLLSPHHLAWGAVLALGVALRLPLTFGTFPRGDGGLFVAMASDIQEAGFRLPDITSYNDAGIPFAYPPFGPMLLAMLHTATGRDLPMLAAMVAAVASALAILAFARLATALLDPFAALWATAIIAVLPQSSRVFLAGGGVTRAPGLLGALIMLGCLVRLWRGGDRGEALGAALGGALVVLSHPSVTWFAVCGAGLLAMCYLRSPRDVAPTLFATFGATALAVPWLAAVVSRHGVAPFLFARQIETGGSGPLALLRLNLTGEPLFPLIAALGLLGILVCAAGRRPALPLWLTATVLLDRRYGVIVAGIPLALLAGVGITDVIVPALARHERTGGYTVRIVATGIAAAYLLVGWGATAQLDTPLPTTERAAMDWVRQHTPMGAQFAVLTGPGDNGYSVLDWFPALTGRASVTTPQGYEWLPGRQYDARVADHVALQSCAIVACLETWAAREGRPFDYLYVADMPGTAAIRAALAATPRYARLYTTGRVAIYAAMPLP